MAERVGENRLFLQNVSDKGETPSRIRFLNPLVCRPSLDDLSSNRRFMPNRIENKVSHDPLFPAFYPYVFNTKAIRPISREWRCLSNETSCLYDLRKQFCLLG